MISYRHNDASVLVLIRLISAGLGLRKVGGALTSAVVVATLFCAPSSALNPEWRLYQYGHRAWKIGNTLPAGGVNAITQDAQGYLWLGTTNGLLRFDGVRFTRCDSLSGTPLTGAILSLLADRDGSLWIGTTDGLRHWDHQRLSSYAEKNREMAVLSMTQDRDGAVWFAPSLLSIHNDALVCEVFHSKLSCYGDRGAVPFLTPSLASTMDPSGTMWLAESEALIAWRNDSLKIYPSYALRNNTSQAGITALSADERWVAARRHLETWLRPRLAAFPERTLDCNYGHGFDGSAHKITKLLIDSHDALWIGTTDEGLYRLYHGRADHFDSHSGLSGDFVVALDEDREGSLWVGTSEGLDQFRDLAVQTLSRTVYPPRRGIRQSCYHAGRNFVDRRGQHPLHSAQWRDGIQSAEGKTSRANKSLRSLAIGRAVSGSAWTTPSTSSAMDSLHQSEWWMAAPPASLSRLRKKPMEPCGRSRPAPREGFSPSIRTRCTQRRDRRPTPSKIVGDPHGGLWIGSNSGDILHLSNGTLSSAEFAHGSGARISHSSVTPDGALLAAGEFGLVSLRNGVAHVLGAAMGCRATNVSNFRVRCGRAICGFTHAAG